MKPNERTSVLQWMPDSRFCWQSHVTRPAPLSVGAHESLAPTGDKSVQLALSFCAGPHRGLPWRRPLGIFLVAGIGAA